MYFLNGSGTELVNSDYIERFCIVAKSDAVLIVASYNQDRKPVTLARYRDESTARAALVNLQTALSEGSGFYAMEESSTEVEEYRPRNGYHGKKNVGHGGS